MFVNALEHFSCDELTRGLCWSRPNFDAFDHFSMMKMAETFCGCGHPPSSATCQRWRPATCPWTCCRPKASRSCMRPWWQTNDEQQTLGSIHGGRRSALCPPVLPVTARTRSCSRARTWYSWPVVCPRTGGRAPSLACALVNSWYSECSSITMNTWDLMKLQHVMSDYLGYTLNVAIQL